jgi:hypothetical protein
MFREEGISFSVCSPFVVMLLFTESVSSLGTSRCSSKSPAMALSRTVNFTGASTAAYSLGLACLLQIRLSFTNHLLPGGLFRANCCCMQGLWKDHGSLVVQIITKVLLVCCTDKLSQRLEGGSHLVGCCLASIIEHVVFECLTEPTLLRFACASVAMALSSTTPT